MDVAAFVLKKAKRMVAMNKYIRCLLEKATLKLLAIQGVGVGVEQKKEVAV